MWRMITFELPQDDRLDNYYFICCLAKKERNMEAKKKKTNKVRQCDRFYRWIYPKSYLVSKCKFHIHKYVFKWLCTSNKPNIAEWYHFQKIVVVEVRSLTSLLKPVQILALRDSSGLEKVTKRRWKNVRYRKANGVLCSCTFSRKR